MVVGCRLLVVGFFGCRLLVVGCWLVYMASSKPYRAKREKLEGNRSVSGFG